MTDVQINDRIIEGMNWDNEMNIALLIHSECLTLNLLRKIEMYAPPHKLTIKLDPISQLAL